MKTNQLFLLLLLVLSCKDSFIQQQSRNISANNMVTGKDSGTVQALYVERGRLETQTYLVCLESRYNIPPVISYDSSYYHSGNCLVLYDKLGKTYDTLQMQGNDLSGHPSPVKILNVTKSLKYETLLLNVVLPDDSDWYTSDFVEYRNGRLKELFTIENFSQPVFLSRKDNETFAGFVTGRDEIVQFFQGDYPVYVSLKDNLVQYPMPDKQYIGFSTIVSNDMKGYTVSVANDTTRLTIKTGTPVMVDTLYRPQKKVRIIVRDTIAVWVPVEEASNNLEPDIAG